jgi:hypothetical protein
VAMCATFAPLEHQRVACSFLPYADPDRWRSMMQYVKFERAEQAAFSVGGRDFGVFVHDWRVEPWDAWWDALGERATSMDPPDEPSVGPAPMLPLSVLSKREFEMSVRQALRDYTRPNALAANPLLRSRLAVESGGRGGGPAALQSILRQALETLESHPRDQKFHRALTYTYFQPAATQESAAERLGVPFSTYRYHLARGVERIVERLWEVELHGARDGSASGGLSGA